MGDVVAVHSEEAEPLYDYELMQHSRGKLEWVDNVVTTETMRGMFTAMVTELANRKQHKAERDQV